MANWTRRAGIAAVALSAVAFSATARAGAGSDDGDFTADELQRLDDGELVERPVTEEQGDLRLMGGTSWQVIEAEPEAVWTALLDTAHYSHMLPKLSEARVVEDTGDSRTVYLRHGGVTHTSYYLDLKVDRKRRSLTFRVDQSRPRGIRAAWGFYTVRPYTHGRSLLVYGVMADIGEGLVQALLRSTVHEWMMKVPWLVKRFVEGSGREFYSSMTQSPVASSSDAAP